jgi:hypothetical protein
MATPASIGRKFAKTKGISVENILQRLQMKEKMALKREGSQNKAIAGVGKLGVSLEKIHRDFNLAKSGGFEGSVLEFMKNPKVAQSFIEKGVALEVNAPPPQPNVAVAQPVQYDGQGFFQRIGNFLTGSK